MENLRICVSVCKNQHAACAVFVYNRLSREENPERTRTSILCPGLKVSLQLGTSNIRNWD